MKTIYLHLNSRDEFFRINISKIVYFESDGNYTHIVLANKTRATVCMNLTQMQDVLVRSLKEHASIFARVGKRHIINYAYVYHINMLQHRLTLSDGEHFVYPLDISKEALKTLKNIYAAPLSGEEE